MEDSSLTIHLHDMKVCILMFKKCYTDARQTKTAIIVSMAMIPSAASENSPSYSSYKPASVYRWHAHSRTVVSHTLHRGQKDTILYSLISYISVYVLATVALT